VLNKEKGTLCEGVGIHRTITLKEHTLTLSCIVTVSIDLGSTDMQENPSTKSSNPMLTLLT